MKNQLSQEQVKLVADTVKTIAEHEGYETYPKEVEVRLVLEAVLFLNKANELLEEQYGVG